MREWGQHAIGELSERDLLIAGAALYAGEGAKGDRRVSFANTNPRMIALFLTWMRRFFAIDETRLRARLYLHKGLDLEADMAHWVDVTDIPRAQFGLPYRAEADPTIRRSKHSMGCLTVSYASARTHRAIIGLMEALLPCPGFPG